jgi:hypothetical protein
MALSSSACIAQLLFCVAMYRVGCLAYQELEISISKRLSRLQTTRVCLINWCNNVVLQKGGHFYLGCCLVDLAGMLYTELQL